jgi:hypothetical protein
VQIVGDEVAQNCMDTAVAFEGVEHQLQRLSGILCGAALIK